MHRSASQLLEYSRCGLAYKLKRVDQVDQLPAAWTFQGTAVHKAVEAWERSKRTMPVLGALQVFTATWDQLIAKAQEEQPNLNQWLRGGRKSTTTDIEDRYRTGRSQVVGYIEYAKQDHLKPLTLPDGEPAVEVGVETEIGGVRVLGYIDLVLEDFEGTPFVRDLKTGTKTPHLPVQLKVYQRGLRDVLGVEADWGDYYMAKDGQPTDPIDLGSFSEPLLERWFTDMDQAERAGIYMPNPSSDNCWSCPVKHHCPVYRSN